METYKFRSSHCTRSVPFKSYSNTKMMSAETNIETVLQKRCFKGISHVFFGGIWQELHWYFFKDLRRFSEHPFSRIALKCFLSSIIYIYRRLWMSFQCSCIYMEIVFNKNCQGFLAWKVVFVFWVLFLLLFPSWIFHWEILQQFNQIDHPHFYLLVIHSKIVKI